MKKNLIIIITVLCCVFLLGSCKDSENRTPTPSNENGPDKKTKKDQGSPDSNSGDTTKPVDKIQTGRPPAATDNQDAETTPPAEQTSTGNDYYTILNQSDDSHIEVSFLNPSLRQSVSILLEEYDCVQVTEAQFQNSIFSIALVNAGTGEEEPFCGAYCSSSNGDCYEQCPVDNYRVLDGWFYDEIAINQSRSLRQTCVPLFQFQSIQL